jgi:hypothetical protein
MDETTIRLAYGFAGLVLGLIAGWASRASRDARALRRALMDDQPDTAPDPADNRPARARRRRVDTSVSVLAVLTLVAVFGSWWTNDRVAGLAECARDYVKASNSSTRPVREAAIQLDAADDRVWRAAEDIFTQSADLDDYTRLREAIDDRNRLSDALERARRDNPPPDPPETFCAER